MMLNSPKNDDSKYSKFGWLCDDDNPLKKKAAF
jgi:hypothetical protein